MSIFPECCILYFCNIFVGLCALAFSMYYKTVRHKKKRKEKETEEQQYCNSKGEHVHIKDRKTISENA